MIKRIIINICLVIVAGISSFLIIGQPPSQPSIDTPSPALARVVANSIHQAVTDPYMMPLEQLSSYLQANQDIQSIRIDLLAKWAPDNMMPICFVRDLEMGSYQIDHPVSPWVLEEVVNRIEVGLRDDNPRNLLQISIFEANGEKYWLGFLRIPYGARHPIQVAGALFSMDQYLEEHIPRFLDYHVNRSRFPITEFERNTDPIRGEADGHISFRILDAAGEVYFQQGRTFAPDKMIYSEKTYFKHPIVCMQKDWDLQVFSSKAVPPVDTKKEKRNRLIVVITAMVLISILYWLGIYSGNKT